MRLHSIWFKTLKNNYFFDFFTSDPPVFVAVNPGDKTLRTSKTIAESLIEKRRIRSIHDKQSFICFVKNDIIMGKLVELNVW